MSRPKPTVPDPCRCGPSAPYDSHEWSCPLNPQNYPPIDSGAGVVERVEWGVDGDGYEKERRHRDDAVAIVAKAPQVRTLVRRTITTITTPWLPLAEELPTSGLTEAEWNSIACQCDEVACPVHDENSDAHIEFTTCDLYGRVMAVVQAREITARAEEKDATLRAVTSQLRVEQIQDPSIYNIWQRIHTCVARARVEGEL